MRVLITGGTGFIGSCVAAVAAAHGHDVHLLARHAVPHADRPLIVRDLALASGLADALGGFDAVVHCAGTLDGSAGEQRTTTVDGTRNLVAAMSQASVRRIVLVSTFAVYDYLALEPGDLLTEDLPLDRDGGARGPYVAAKREQEMIVRGGPGLDWTILRPGLVFGPGRTWFYDLGARLHRVWVTLGGTGTLPLTQVDNCSAAIVAALDEPGSVGATINVVDNDLPTRSRYVEWLAAHETRRPLVMDVPWALLSGASQGAWILARRVLRDRVVPPGSLHPAVLAARCKPLRYDNSLARSVLAWAPRITIQDGVRLALEEPGAAD